MCGILAILGSSVEPTAARERALKLSARLRHRGPDWNGIVQVGPAQKHILAHERLSIVDLDSGAQPLVDESHRVYLTVNGEIFNHTTLKKNVVKNYKFLTESDCEVIIPLYLQFGQDFVQHLDGQFAFVLYDSQTDEYIAARDHIGICSMYIGWADDGSVWFASELKALKEDCTKIEPFPPGQIYSSKTKGFRTWYHPSWYDEKLIPSLGFEDSKRKIRELLESAVKKQLMSDVPYGVLLSGGLDSSLIAAITSRLCRKRIEDEGKSEAWWPRLHSFSVGLRGAPDLKFAQEVATFLGTVHHEYHFTVQDGFDALRDLIWKLETYDITTIRASTPMYLMSRKIKAMGVKMVLSGEGSDELFGGYLYFHNAPNREEFHEETVRRVKGLHKSDCLRADKSTMSWGLELRVPFLDREFVDMVMNIDPQFKLCGNNDRKIEKYILRTAFDDKEHPYLPDNILWRQKEQFSDGVGYNWIDGLKAYTEQRVTDEAFAQRAERFPHDTPPTKEAFYYRTIFEELFPQRTCERTVAYWIPNTKWGGVGSDPSGRAQKVHLAHKTE
eukprot:TRINITY_DN2855_c0_g1_i1.p1 TRINITY_DN2855_c0_g1~~TRINITY_DN2855_c0_g1_i1.p1  ORF type:complete len:557 (-),score=156.29 TRINITY_DN2855_c0_g1_i1:103-1773(-)